MVLQPHGCADQLLQHNIHCDAAWRLIDPTIVHIAQGLRVLRPRILAFLGRSGAAAEALVRSAALQMPLGGAAAASSSRASDALLQWDLHRRAGLTLPFGDLGRLQLWLDPLLPQVWILGVLGFQGCLRRARARLNHYACARTV